MEIKGYEQLIVWQKAMDLTVEVYRLAKILPKEERNVQYRVRLHRYLVAPIEEGTKVGEVIFFDGDEEIGRVNLVATKTVLVNKRKNLFDRLKKKSSLE